MSVAFSTLFLWNYIQIRASLHIWILDSKPHFLPYLGPTGMQRHKFAKYGFWISYKICCYSRRLAYIGPIFLMASFSFYDTAAHCSALGLSAISYFKS